MDQPLVVAIDGPAAAGKGTLARRLATALDLPYLDTGLLYRAVGRRVLDAGADPTDPAAAHHAALGLRAEELARTDLRGADADRAASQVAAHPDVRAALLAFQRGFGQPRGAVLDGRDIGTVVFPDATVKLFVTADLAARAHRRWLQVEAGRKDGDAATTLEAVADETRQRDTRDAGRDAAPMRPAPDAVVLDTTALDADAAFQRALAVVRQRGGGGA